MPRRRPDWVLVIAMAVSVAATGCASFHQHRLPEIDEVPPSPTESSQPTATYSFSYAYKIVSEREASEIVRQEMSREFAAVLTDSGRFASVTEAPSGGDIHIEAHLRNFGSPAGLIPAFITGFTFFVIPSWATDQWTLTARVLQAGEERHSYTLSDSDVLVQWLPMIVVMPFKFPGRVIPELRKNLYRNLVKDLTDSGALSAR